MELSTGMIQGGDAQEGVLVGDLVVLLLHLRCLGQAAVFMKDGLGKARGAGGKVDRRQLPIAFRKGGAVVPYVNQQAALAELFRHAFNAPDELRAKHQDLDLCQVCAILDLLGGIAEVKGHCQSPCFEDAKVDRQPLQAVIHENGHLIALFHPPREEHVGKPVGLFVKDIPSDFPAVGLVGGGLDEVILFPGDTAGLLHLRVELHQGSFIPVELNIAFQKISYRHSGTVLSFCWDKKAAGFVEPLQL